MLKTNRKFAVKAAVLAVVGLLLFLLTQINRQSSFVVRIADLFFVEATVFAVYGIIRTLGNMHAFDSTAWGFRQLHRIFRREKMSGAKEKEDYLAFRERHAYREDAKPMLLIAGGLLILSVIASLISMKV